MKVFRTAWPVNYLIQPCSIRSRFRHVQRCQLVHRIAQTADVTSDSRGLCRELPVGALRGGVAAAATNEARRLVNLPSFEPKVRAYAHFGNCVTSLARRISLWLKIFAFAASRAERKRKSGCFYPLFFKKFLLGHYQ